MNSLVIALFFVMEVALLLGVGVALLKRRNSSLQQQIRTLQAVQKPDEKFASIASGYLPYLEKQIIDTRAQAELQQGEDEVDERLALALAHRLALLEAEKKVTESSNDYPERHWEHVIEHFTPPPPESAADESGTVEAQSEHGAEAGAQKTVTQLIEAVGQQGDALTSLRTVFEQVKAQPDNEALDNLEKQLKELERRFSEANTCVEIMEQENQRLQHEMEREEQRMERERHEDAVEFAQQLGKQKQNVSALCNTINALQLEAGKAGELQAQLAQFEASSRELTLCIDIMEEENLFLREQVQALIKMDKEDADKEKRAAAANEELSSRIASLQVELEEKQNSMAELEVRFAEMEKEYLLLYEKSRSGVMTNHY